MRSLALVAVLAVAAVVLVVSDRRSEGDPVGALGGSDGAANGGSTDVVLASPSEGRSGRSSAGEEAASESSAATAGGGRVEIVVRRRGTGAPVPGALVSVFGDEMEAFVADDEGKLTVPVPAGSVLVGADAPGGSGLLALPYDDETGEPSAEKTVEVGDGETVSVDLFLHVGASITGHVLDPEGAPVAGFELVRMHGESGQWSRPKSIRTDENGRFVVSSLEANWYLLSPHPEGDETFPFERFELAAGETRDVEIRLAPGRLATVRVEVVQEESGEPYPFPAFATMVRADGVAELAVDRAAPWKRLGYTRVSPIEFEHEIRTASYRVTVERRAGWLYDDQEQGVVLARNWRREVVFEVSEDLADPVVRVEVPKLGRIADVRGHLTRPVEGERPGLRAKYRDNWGRDQVVVLHGREQEGAFRLLVDVDHVENAKVVFAQTNAKGETVLAEHLLQEGVQDVTLTPTRD